MVRNFRFENNNKKKHDVKTSPHKTVSKSRQYRVNRVSDLIVLNKVSFLEL